MKKSMVRVAAFMVAITGGTLLADERGATIFSDDFTAVGTFVENWSSKHGTKSVDGIVRYRGGNLEWRGEAPEEYVVDADVRVSDDYRQDQKNSHWIGFWIDGCQRFQIQPVGAAFVIANGAVSYDKIKNYRIGDWVHLRLVKKLTGQVRKYIFYVNGQCVCQFADTKPPRRDPIAFLGNVPFEIDNFAVSRVRHDDDSNNLVFNGGFEADEDGLPIYYNLLGDFDWTRPVSEYETDYLKRYSVDRTVKHSGKQSFRVTLAPCVDEAQFWPWQVGTVKGCPGVMSVWAKTDIPGGVEVELTYGGPRRKVRISGDWRRYETGCVNLPAKSTYSRANIRVFNRDRIRGHVWFDDLQAEIVKAPEQDDGLTLDEPTGGAFDFEKKSYATPFRPSELDRGRLTRPLPPKPAPNGPDFRHPASRRPGVLGRLDFYMDEPYAEWRITDDAGKTVVAKKPLSDIPPGTNRVEFAAGGKTYSDAVVKLPFRKGATQVNRWTRSLVHDGTNVLFTGLCLEPVGSPFDYEGKKYPGMFELLESRGFRHYQTLSHLCWKVKYPRAGIGKTIACFDEGLKRGFLHLNWWGSEALNDISRCDGRLGWPKDRNALNIEEVVKFHEKYDNILSHLVLDEPELSASSEWTEEKLVFAKKYFPYVPVQMNNSVLGVPRRHGNLRTDVLMIDDYLTNKEGRDVAGVLGNLDALLWADDAKPCGFFLVGDNMTLHYRLPTYGEQIAQSWGTICSGASIVSWYIGFPHGEGSWRAMVDVNREAQQLAPAILSEELCGQSVCSEGWKTVRHLTRKHKGEAYLFTVNIHAGALEGVAFTLPADTPKNGTVEVLFENRTLELKNGCFTDSYRPHERHLYRIK